MHPQIIRTLQIAVLALLICLAPTGVQASKFQILLIENGVPVWVEREDPSIATAQQAAQSPDEAMAATLERMVTAQLAGPTASEAAVHLSGLFPPGSMLDRVDVIDGRATVRLTLSEEFLNRGLDELTFENIVHITIVLGESTPGLQSLTMLARTPGDSDYHPLSDFLPALPPPIDKPELERTDTVEPVAAPQMLGSHRCEGNLSQLVPLLERQSS